MRSSLLWATFASAAALGLLDMLAVVYAPGLSPDALLSTLAFAPRLLLAWPLLCTAWAALLTSVWGRIDAGAGRRGVRLAAGVAALPLMLCMPPLFSGAAISAVPWRWPLLVLCLGACWIGSFLLHQAARHVAQAQARPTVAAALVVGAVATLLCVREVSMHVLPRLYAPFHRGLALGAVGLCAALLVGPLSWRKPRRKPWPGWAFVLLAIGAWVLSGLPIARAAVGRSAIIEYTAFAGYFVGPMFRADALLQASIDHAPPNVRPQRATNVQGVRFESNAALRDVLLITVDALRGDVMRADTPVGRAAPGLQALGLRGLRFEDAYSPSNGTVRSVLALLTGDAATEPATAATEMLLPIAWARGGYQTRAWFTAHRMPPVREELGTLRDRGFDFTTYDDRYDDAHVVLDRVRTALLRGEQPTFSWVHLSDVHAPFMLRQLSARPGMQEKSPYIARVSGLDLELERFFAWLSKARPDVIWALTADHGEALGEHGTTGHGSSLYEEQVRVPLLIGGRGIAPARITSDVSTLFLPATLLALAGAHLPSEVGTLPGISLGGNTQEGALVFVPGACAWVQDRYKLIADANTGAVSLFNLLSDPTEVDNRAARERVRALHMFDALRARGCRLDLSRLRDTF
jgi:hypothetical protein